MNHSLLVPSPFEGHLGFLQAWAVWIKLLRTLMHRRIHGPIILNIWVNTYKRNCWTVQWDCFPLRETATLSSKGAVPFCICTGNEWASPLSTHSPASGVVDLMVPSSNSWVVQFSLLFAIPSDVTPGTFFMPPCLLCLLVERHLLRSAAQVVMAVLVSPLLTVKGSWAFWIQILYQVCVFKMFSPVCGLPFNSLNSIFYRAKVCLFLILMKPRVYSFSLISYAFGVVSKNSSPNPRSYRFSPVLPSRIL